jgi:LysM repeat protein
LEINPNQSDLILTQQPKKLDLNTINNPQINTITTLSNRELLQEDKVKIDSVTSLNFQNEILKQDSMITKSNPDNTNFINKNQFKLDSMAIVNLPNSQDSTKQKIDITKIDELEVNKIDSLNKIDVQPKTTSDIFRNNTISVENKSVNETNVATNQSDLPKPNNRQIAKNIKIEQVEDFNDSSILIIETKTKTPSKIANNNRKKNYEIARDRQHQILDHDTLAIRIIKDTVGNAMLKKPIKKVAKPRNINYKVRNGDNLSFIAEKHNVTVNEIKTWNRLKNDNLSIGQIIIIKK